MRTKPSYANKSIKLLTKIVIQNPEQSIGQHLTLAFGEFNTINFISDKAFFETLDEYNNELELDNYCDELDMEDQNTLD